jgi:hypothetical protein
MAYRASLSFYFSFLFENLLAEGFWPLLLFLQIDDAFARSTNHIVCGTRTS